MLGLLLAALSLAVGWIGLSWVGMQEAVAAGEAFARQRGPTAFEVQAMPRPASPFDWTVVVSQAEQLHLAHLNTRQTKPLIARADDHFIRRVSAPYQPLSSVRWQTVPRFGADSDDAAFARAAWQRPKFAFYRWFAQVPVLEQVEQRRDASGGEQRCASFQDLRFGFTGRTELPFRYGLCIDASDQVAIYKRGDGEAADLRVASVPAAVR